MLKEMVDEMKIYPIQVNGDKCAFGHFYHSIKINHPEVKEDWDSIDGVHSELHGYGHLVVQAVKENDNEKAKEYYEEAAALSKIMLEKLEIVLEKIEDLDKKGVQILKQI